MSDIIKLQGRQFDWKRDDRGHDIGVIAQEVQEVVPEYISDEIAEYECKICFFYKQHPYDQCSLCGFCQGHIEFMTS